MLIYRECEISVFHYVRRQQQQKNKVKRVWFYLEFGDLCLNNGFIIENEIHTHCAYEVQIGVVEKQNGGKLLYRKNVFVLSEWANIILKTKTIFAFVQLLFYSYNQQTSRKSLCF